MVGSMTEKDIRFKISYAMEEAEKIVQEFEKKFLKHFKVDPVGKELLGSHVTMVLEVAHMITNELNRKENKQRDEELKKEYEENFKRMNEEIFRRLNIRSRKKSNSKEEVGAWAKKYLRKEPPIKVGDKCPYCAEIITSKDHYCV